jgi:hypothetical protein
MIVKQNLQSYPYPTMFLLGSRKFFDSDQRIGALIAKQKGTTGLWAPVDILLADEPYTAGDFSKVRLESDVVAFKPSLDLLVVSDEAKNGLSFGTIQVIRNTIAGSQVNFIYGWRARASGNRESQAGDVAAFQPNIHIPWKLPDGFNNLFFNGSPVIIGPQLQTGDQVKYTKTSPQNPDVEITVTIPAAPQLKFRQDGREIPAPTFISRGVDTVVYDETLGSFLLTRRFVFVWDARYELATLEVS